MKIKIVIFTAWPQLIIASKHKFEVLFEESVDQILTSTFGSADIDQGMERYAVRVHDRKLYEDFEYCLLVNQPVTLDLENILELIDAEHTAYVAQDRIFVLYRRDKIWQQKNIFFPLLDIKNLNPGAVGPQLFTPEPENVPEHVGIIFIDCWQIINDITEWKHLPFDFDLYQTMLYYLSKYRADNMVFHTGEFGNYRLAEKLLPWYRQGNAVDILDLEVWTRHYQARNLRSWIVVGAHWQRCTHEKPLGFANLLDIKKLDPELRIFSHMDCTVKFLNNNLENPICTTCNELDYQQDVFQWKITGRIAELVGPV